jgi:flagellar basal-body rod modification protein FlgD
MLTPIRQSSSENRAPVIAPAANQSLGQSDFLKLLTTQLVNQSPLNPMDNEAFMGQMAQFSTVSGISEMNATLKQLTARFGSGQFSAASSMIGKSALVSGGDITLTAGQTVSGSLDVPENTSSVVISVTDSSGRAVRRMTFNTPAIGAARFGWDGRDDLGKPVGDGQYTVAALAHASGRNLTITPSLRQTIVAARMPEGAAEPVLQLANGQSIAFSALREIAQ